MPPLFRADHIGSLIRPTRLRDATQSIGFYEQIAASDDLLAVHEGIRYAAKQQLTLSVRPITTGEFDRRFFLGGFFENLEGIETQHAVPIEGGPFRSGLFHLNGIAKLGHKNWPTWVATGKIKHVKPCFLDSWDRLKAAVPPPQWKECKMTLPSVTTQHIHMKRGEAYLPGVYSSDKEYFSDLIVAYRKELQILYDAGLRSVQVDDPLFTCFVDQNFLNSLKNEGVDPNELLLLYIWAHNECLRDLPKDLHVGIHICRGNAPKNVLDEFGPHSSFEPIAQRVFGGLDFHTLYLQVDEGDLEPLRFIPRGTNAVLGVVDTKTPELEQVEAIVKRVREAAGVIAKGQERSVEEVLADSIAVSPTCGFCSVIFFDGVQGERRMWEKLCLVQDVARHIWPESTTKA
ncbi:unnamed protein product [Clonostachys rhizophaga]|uniref:Cobalamin-independent methionine synthase MetE C-terminal/archaeal domain-containing protein n=1 Tax=Clonostachys rhizophaga TaxID=160324 RepID=A0A9N9VQ05_9HYPO|nr:unnamed protein product [Clonostachys rhizophaga]